MIQPTESTHCNGIRHATFINRLLLIDYHLKIEWRRPVCAHAIWTRLVTRPEEYSYEQSVKYESFFVLSFYVDEVTQQRRRKLATLDIAIHNLYKDRRYLLGYLLMFQFRIWSNSILMLVLWLYNWDYESVSPNRKPNLITWWICFSTRRNDTCFTKTPPTQGSRKVVWFMQNEPQFNLYRAQLTNVKIYR